MSSKQTKPHLPLLDQQANQLLDQFGSGSHTPGSGCAAALMGLLAAQLTLTVCRISTEGGQAGSADLRYLAREMETTFLPSLRDLFQRDADLFDEVIEARRNRERAKGDREKRQWNEKSLELLRQATELVLEVADLCSLLIDHGMLIFDQGAKKVRGDSGAAISAAIAAVSTSIFVANLNLRSFRGGQWAQVVRGRLDSLTEEITARQSLAFKRVASLQLETFSDDQLSFLDQIAAPSHRLGSASDH